MSISGREAELRGLFGGLVYEVRDELGESQEDFAARFAGWDQRRVWRVEHARVPVTISLVEEVASATQRHASYFLNPLVMKRPPTNLDEWKERVHEMVVSTMEVTLHAATVDFARRTARPDAKAVVRALASLDDSDVRLMRRLVETMAHVARCSATDGVQGDSRRSGTRRGARKSRERPALNKETGR